MERGLEWYKREPIAFLDAVQGLGAETIGAYAVLLDLIYARGGETQRDDRHLAGVLGCSIRKARSLTDRLISLGKIDVQGDFVTNSRAKSESFSRRNLRETRAKSGRTGGERSAEVRKNKGLTEAGASTPVQAEKIREDKIKGNATHYPKNRGSRIGQDWQLSSALGQWAVEQGLDPDQVRLEAEKFRDYWSGVSGQKGVKLDWAATWRNWIRKAVEGISEKGGKADARFNRAVRTAERSKGCPEGGPGGGGGDGRGDLVNLPAPGDQRSSLSDRDGGLAEYLVGSAGRGGGSGV